VAYTLVQIAGDGPKTRNLASIYVRLTPIEDRRRDQFAVMDDVRSRILPPLSTGLRTAVQPVANIGGGGNQNADIQFIINGPDLAKLDTYSKQLVERVRKMKGVVDVDTSLNAGKPEISVQIDRPKAADMGVQIADAAEAMRLLVAGDQVTTYNEGGEQYEVHLRAQLADRSTQEAIAALTVPSSRLGTVSLDKRRHVLTRLGAVRHQSAAPSASGHGVRQPAARRIPGRSAERDGGGVPESQGRTGVPRRADGTVARARPGGAELPARLRAVAHLHVSDPWRRSSSRGCIRSPSSCRCR